MEWSIFTQKFTGIKFFIILFDYKQYFLEIFFVLVNIILLSL